MHRLPEKKMHPLLFRTGPDYLPSPEFRICPLSSGSSTRFSRSMKSLRASRMPPIRNQTVEMTPTMPGTTSEVMKNLIVHHSCGHG